MVLVTGGTGLVGAHLLYFLLNEGYSVRAIHRSKSNLLAVKNVFSYYTENPDALYKKIEWFEADLTDIPALTEAFQGIEKVYHAAAYVSFHPKHFHKLKKSNIEGTANIVNLCLYSKVKKLCHISSIATLGKEDKANSITEELQWNPDDDNNVYAITKYGAEMEVWRATQEGLDAVIVNPGVILGSGFWDGGTGAIFSKVNKGLTYYTNGTMGFVDVRDVAKICFLLMESTIKSDFFILVSENTSYKDLLTNIALRMEKKPPKKELKPWVLQWAWKLDKFRSIITCGKQQLFKSTANAIVSKKKYSNQKIKNTIPYDFIPLDKTITDIVANFQKSTL